MYRLRPAEGPRPVRPSPPRAHTRACPSHGSREERPCRPQPAAAEVAAEASDEILPSRITLSPGDRREQHPRLSRWNEASHKAGSDIFPGGGPPPCQPRSPKSDGSWLPGTFPHLFIVF